MGDAACASCCAGHVAYRVYAAVGSLARAPLRGCPARHAPIDCRVGARRRTLRPAAVCGGDCVHATQPTHTHTHEDCRGGHGTLLNSHEGGKKKTARLYKRASKEEFVSAESAHAIASLASVVRAVQGRKSRCDRYECLPTPATAETVPTVTVGRCRCRCQCQCRFRCRSTSNTEQATAIPFDSDFLKNIYQQHRLPSKQSSNWTAHCTPQGES